MENLKNVKMNLQGGMSGGEGERARDSRRVVLPFFISFRRWVGVGYTSGTKATARVRGNFEEGRGKSAAKGRALRVYFSQASRPGLNCAAPRRRSRDAESTYGADCVLEQIKRGGGTPFLREDKLALQRKLRHAAPPASVFESES